MNEMRSENSAGVLLATDFSPASKAAERLAVNLARSSGGRLTVLHVLEASGNPAGPGGTTPSEAFARSMKEGLEKLDDTARDLAGQGLTVAPLVVEGLPAEQILACAEHHEVTVLGLASKRRWRLFWKRTCQTVVERSKRPVVLVRP
jgi:nucleotide-binding universal stress UspA family protein